MTVLPESWPFRSPESQLKASAVIPSAVTIGAQEEKRKLEILINLNDIERAML